MFANRFESVIFAILGAPAIEFAQEFAHWPSLDSPAAAAAPVVAAFVPSSPPSRSPLGSVINNIVASSAPSLVVATPVVAAPASPPGGPITLPDAAANHVDLASSLTLP